MTHLERDRGQVLYVGKKFLVMGPELVRADDGTLPILF